MELIIALPDSSPKQQIILLKNHIDRTIIDGITGTEIERATYIDGQLGIGDLLNSISAVIQAAEQPLLQLVVCLQKFVDNYRTEITITNGSGKSLNIKSGKKIDQDAMKSIVNDYLQNSANP